MPRLGRRALGGIDALVATRSDDCPGGSFMPLFICDLSSHHAHSEWRMSACHVVCIYSVSVDGDVRVRVSQPAS